MYLKDFESDLLIIREIFPLFLIPLLIHWNCSIFLKGYYCYVDGSFFITWIIWSPPTKFYSLLYQVAIAIK